MCCLSTKSRKQFYPFAGRAGAESKAARKPARSNVAAGSTSGKVKLLSRGNPPIAMGDGPAVGVLAPNDSVELHNLPLMIHVKCRKRPDTDEIVNEVKGYSPKAAQAEPPAVKPAPAANNNPPWKR